MKTYKHFATLVLLAITCLLLSTMAFSKSVATPGLKLYAPLELPLQVGDSQILVYTNATRVAVGDPVVADVVAISTNEILVNAKSPGKTVVYVWDNSMRKVTKITVSPTQVDMNRLCTQIRNELKDDRITVSGVGNTVMLEGTVSHESESSRAESIARAVAEMSIFQGASADESTTESKTVARPSGDSFIVEKVTGQQAGTVSAKVGLRTPKVVNMIQIERPLDEVTPNTMQAAASIRQALQNPAITVRALPVGVVVLEGRVGTAAELAAIDQLLKGWNKEGKDDKGMADSSKAMNEKVTIVDSVVVDSSISRQVMVRAQVVDINKSSLKDFGVEWGRVTLDQTTNALNVSDQPWMIGFSGLFTGKWDAAGLNPVGARIRALQQQNKAKILSEPNLLVLDGKEAKMLVGGEIPIPIVQSSSGGVASVSVEYKEFGVRLTMTPVVTSDNTVQLQVTPEVSELDFANAVRFSGFVIPALTTRRAETMVNIKDGQSLIIGGLIQNKQSKLLNKIPVLGDLPIIGELFKSRSFQNDETELVIIITPQIMKPGTVAVVSSAAPATASVK